jgi:hypothetical protein
MKHLYIGSGAAVRSTWSGSHNTVEIEHMSFQYAGDSDDEAYGWAMKALHDRFPIDAGYSHHHARIDRQNPLELQALLNTLRPESRQPPTTRPRDA